MKRANRITVKTDDGILTATFKRTHNIIATIPSSMTDWVANPEDTKNAQREEFRKWCIANANKFDINYDPTNRQNISFNNKSYSDDIDLTTNAILLNEPYLRELAEKRVGIKWCDMIITNIKPKTTTNKGVPLNNLGIEDGKYIKSGKWAWADLIADMHMEYKDADIYVGITLELISGQLKKWQYGTQMMLSLINTELQELGLLDTADGEDNIEESVENTTTAVTTEVSNTDITANNLEQIEKMKKPELLEYAKTIGCIVDKKSKIANIRADIRECILNS